MLWQFSTGYCRCWQSIGILGMHRFHMKTLTVRSGGYPDFFPSENETALEHWNGGAIVILNWITIYLIHWITIVLLIVILPMVVINQPIRVLVMFISMDWCEGESAGHPFFFGGKKIHGFLQIFPETNPLTIANTSKFGGTQWSRIRNFWWVFQTLGEALSFRFYA